MNVFISVHHCNFCVVQYICMLNQTKPNFKLLCFSDMEGAGCATMTDLYKSRTESDGMTAKGPIYVLDAVTNDVLITPTAFTGKWLVTSELYVTGGETCYMYVHTYMCILVCVPSFIHRYRRRR